MTSVDCCQPQLARTGRSKNQKRIIFLHHSYNNLVSNSYCRDADGVGGDGDGGGDDDDGC